MNDMNYFTTMVLDLTGDILKDVLSKVGFAFTEIYTYTVEINQTQGVAAVTGFTTLLGAALCALAVAKQSFGTYGLGTEGDPDQDPVEIIFRLCKALGMMGINSWLFTEMVKLSNALGKDVTNVLINNAGDMSITLVEKLFALLATILATQSPVGVICMAAVVIGIIVFAISACIRGAELTLSKVLLPIFSLDILNANPEKWNMFIFQYGINFFSYVVQLFCFNTFIIQFLTISESGIDFKEILVLSGWLILSIRAPKWLEKYIYATGTGRAMSQGASRLGQVVMMVGMRI